MRAVWSFWTKPYLAHRRSAWLSEKHHFLSWVLSVERARRHYPDTMLVTDDAGARILVDGLGLAFRRVSTALNALRDRDPAHWSLGKSYAYFLQDVPFVHIDSDVFLWRRLHPDVEGAPVLAQNEEPFRRNEFYYFPEEFEREARAVCGAWLPLEWRWYRSSLRPQKGLCCGVFGGQRVDFIRHYAALSIRLVEEAVNGYCWRRLQHVCSCLLFEQYLLAACLEYHGACPASPFRGVRAVCVFPSLAAAYEPSRAALAGYTHLLAGAKHDVALAERLERRVLADHPAAYDRCIRYLRERRGAAVGPVPGDPGAVPISPG